MSSRVAIDTSKCTGCMLCVEVCFTGTFCRGDDGKAAVGSDAGCISCGHCVAVCPVGAVSNPRLLGEAPHLPAGEAPGYASLMAMLSMRRSRREFKEESVPRDVIEKLLAAGAQAPNAMSMQLVHYTVITDPGVQKLLSDRAVRGVKHLGQVLRSPLLGPLFRARYGGLYPSLQKLLPEIDMLAEAHAAGRDLVLHSAPCAILFHTPPSDVSGPEDAILCASNVILAAEALGLGTCVIGFVTGTINQDREMKRLVHIPDDHTVHSTLIVGYPRFRYSRPAPRKGPNVQYV